jgi:anthraniloyl-CoA monooxygenase
MNAVRPSSTTGHNIACVGAGPAGLYFAILMKQWVPTSRVTILERHAESSPIGWGVTLYLDALTQTDPPSAREIRERAFHWQGNVVHVAGQPPVAVSTPGHSIGRRALVEILVQRARSLNVEILFEHEVTRQTELDKYDLIIAADGVKSVLRDAHAAAFGTAIAYGANKYIWLGTSRVFEAFTFPFVRTEAGWVWAYAYAFDAGMSTFIVETSAQTWAKLGFDGMNTTDTMRRLETIFADWLDRHQLQPPGGTADVTPWLQFQTVTNRKWHVGKVVLMGDAAHTTHFTIGSGTRLAIADAISLASHLRSNVDIEAALDGYETQRLTELRSAQRDARNSASWFESLALHIERDPAEFTELLYARNSAFLHVLPASGFLWLRRFSQRYAVTARLRRAWRALSRRSGPFV